MYHTSLVVFLSFLHTLMYFIQQTYPPIIKLNTEGIAPLEIHLENVRGFSWTLVLEGCCVTDSRKKKHRGAPKVVRKRG